MSDGFLFGELVSAGNASELIRTDLRDLYTALGQVSEKARWAMELNYGGKSDIQAVNGILDYVWEIRLLVKRLEEKIEAEIF